MELSYLQDCPSCGAPVEVAEADRVVTCKYCDGRNYMVQGGPLRFVLPDMIPGKIAENEIIHIPYLRFKGHIYSCAGAELEHKIVDTTHLGYDSNQMPVSLGLRPQAMQIRLVGLGHRGRFAKITEEVSEVFTKAAKLTTAFSDDRSTLYHRSFIGETISCIYLPTYLKNGSLMDGVLNREIAVDIPAEKLLSETVPSSRKWLPRFISTICPNCAAQMEGASDSLVMECRNCESLWQEENGSFKKIEFSVIKPQQGDAFLPFWKIGIEGEGIALKNYADFLRISNQPIVVREEHERMPLYFWLPAFKIRPKYFLHAAKNITISQKAVPSEIVESGYHLYSVTLPLKEAVQALKAVFTEAVMAKRNFMPYLPKFKFRIHNAQLTFLPFHPLGQDLIQDHTSVTLPKKIMIYGRAM